MIRLVAADLDGTIINASGICDSSVPAAVRELRQAGVAFAICSGRPVASITGLLAGWHLEGEIDYLIGSGGGEVLDMKTGRMVVPYLLDVPLIREIIDLYEPEGLIPTMYEGAMFYAQKITPQVQVVADRVGQEVREGDIRTLTVKPQIKVMFVLNPEDMAAAEEFERAHRDPRYIGFRTAPDLLEFNDARLNKDTGLAIAAEMMGITAGEIMAFGDTTNDIAMLRYAGTGICMANGTQDAMDAADDIAPSVDEQGFARYVRAHILK